ncbi:hypothetical protein, partial [Escherichia coli]|uniref:hypothetical protein n=1 Tax=Escherichia coli TaxID=562 RepID=UPI00215AE945
MAFFTARRWAIEQMKAGKLRDLNGGVFKGQIDDDQFLALVTDRAKALSLNMGKAGQLTSFSGFGST